MRDGTHRAFKDRLSLENWAEIPDEEKLGHSAAGCKACAKIEKYGLLESNQPFITLQHSTSSIYHTTCPPATPHQSNRDGARFS